MAAFYRANQVFKSYITSLGLVFHDRSEEDFSYYTHKSGKQIKVDTKNYYITLLDSKGEIVKSSSCFTEREILKFLED